MNRRVDLSEVVNHEPIEAVSVKRVVGANDKGKIEKEQSKKQ